MTENELPDPMPHWSYMKPIPASQPKKWHAKVGLDERKQCIGLIATMLNDDLEDPNVMNDHERIHKQISVARKEERKLFEMATSTNEYFQLWRERLTEVSYDADELLDQEDDVIIDQQVQNVLDEITVGQRGRFRQDGTITFPFGPNTSGASGSTIKAKTGIVVAAALQANRAATQTEAASASKDSEAAKEATATPNDNDTFDDQNSSNGDKIDTLETSNDEHHYISCIVNNCNPVAQWIER